MSRPMPISIPYTLSPAQKATWRVAGAGALAGVIASLTIGWMARRLFHATVGEALGQGAFFAVLGAPLGAFLFVVPYRWARRLLRRSEDAETGMFSPRGIAAHLAETIAQHQHEALCGRTSGHHWTFEEYGHSWDQLGEVKDTYRVWRCSVCGALGASDLQEGAAVRPFLTDSSKILFYHLVVYDAFKDVLRIAVRYQRKGMKNESSILACAAFEYAIRRVGYSNGRWASDSISSVAARLRQSGMMTPAMEEQLVVFERVRSNAMTADWDGLELRDIMSVIETARALVAEAPVVVPQ